MVRTGGGGVDLPLSGNPIELLVVLLVVGCVVWLTMKVLT